MQATVDKFCITGPVVDWEVKDGGVVVKKLIVYVF